MWTSSSSISIRRRKGRNRTESTEYVNKSIVSESLNPLAIKSGKISRNNSDKKKSHHKLADIKIKTKSLPAISTFLNKNIIHRRNRQYNDKKNAGNKMASASTIRTIEKLNNMGVGCVHSEQLKKASRYLKKSLDKCKKSYKKRIFATTIAHDINSSNSSSSSRSFDDEELEKKGDTYIYQRGIYDEGMNTFSNPVTINEDDGLLSSIVCALTTVLFNLGIIQLRSHNDEEAFKYFSRALEMSSSDDNGSNNYDRDGNEDHHRNNNINVDGASTVAILHNIGHIQYRSGRNEDAMRTYEKALHILRKTRSNRINKTKALSSSSLLCSYLQTQKKSSPLSHHSILIDDGEGDDDNEAALAATLNCLGVVSFHVDSDDSDDSQSDSNNDNDDRINRNQSLKYYRESLSIQRQRFDGECDDDCEQIETKEIATTLNNIGRIYYIKGKHDDAINCYNRALKMRRNLFGNLHIDVGATAYNAGQTYHQDGDLDTAMALYKEFLIIAKKHLGCEHRDVGTILKCIAQIHHQKKSFKDALRLYKEAINVCKIALSTAHHPEIASIMNKLGNLLFESGDYDDAISAYKEGLDVERSVLARCHPNIIVTLVNIGQIYKLREQYEKALPMYREAVDIQRQNFGHSHLKVSDTLSSIALIQYQMLNFSQALNVYQEVLRIRRDAHGDNHLDIASTMNSIGRVLFKMDLNEYALQSFNESLRMRRNELGVDHRDIAYILYNIGTIYLQTGNEETAIKFYLETLRIEQKSLGKFHIDVVATIQHLAQVYQQQGEYSNAVKYFKESLQVQKKYHNEEQTVKDNAKNKEQLSNIAQTFNHIGNISLQLAQTKETVLAYSEAIRYFRLAGKSDEELKIYGFNLYGVCKMHPECASAA